MKLETTLKLKYTKFQKITRNNFFKFKSLKNTFDINLDIIEFTVIGPTRQIHLVGKSTLFHTTAKHVEMILPRRYIL